MVAAALVTNLASLWAEANADQRRRLAAEIFIAVYCDLDARQVVALQMNRALLPLRSALPTSVSWSGSDGIRTRDLLRDRQEKPSFRSPRMASSRLVAPRPPEEARALHDACYSLNIAEYRQAVRTMWGFTWGF